MVNIDSHELKPITEGKVYQAITDTGDMTHLDSVYIVDDKNCLRPVSVKCFAPYNPKRS